MTLIWIFGEPQSPVQSNIDSIASATTSARTAANWWTTGDLPREYLVQQLQTTRAQVQTQKELLQRSPSIPRDQGERVLATLPAIEGTLDQMAVAVEQNDRMKMLQQLERLSAGQRILEEVGASLAAQK